RARSAARAWQPSQRKPRSSRTRRSSSANCSDSSGITAPLTGWPDPGRWNKRAARPPDGGGAAPGTEIEAGREDLATVREDLVERILEVRGAVGDRLAHLVGVLLPALLDLFLEQRLERSVPQPFPALGGMIDHHVGDERPRQPPGLLAGVLGEERIDRPPGRSAGRCR